MLRVWQYYETVGALLSQFWRSSFLLRCDIASAVTGYSSFGLRRGIKARTCSWSPAWTRPPIRWVHLENRAWKRRGRGCSRSTDRMSYFSHPTDFLDDGVGWYFPVAPNVTLYQGDLSKMLCIDVVVILPQVNLSVLEDRWILIAHD